MKSEEMEQLVQERLSPGYIITHCLLIFLSSLAIIILQVFAMVFNVKANYAGSGFWYKK
jgi:hypothetical protein